jgi:CHRD domain
MLKPKTKIAILLLIVSTALFSCKKSETVPDPTVVKHWMITLSAKNEVPAPAGRNETGSAMLELLTDGSLRYSISVTGLASGDALTNSHIHVGNVITSSGVILDLKPSFSNGTASATITGLRSTFIDSLKDDSKEMYLNVHSTQAPAGIVRGQLNKTIELAADVALSPANEVPAGTSTATGLAIIRVTSDKQVYARLTVSNLETSDALTAAHIHKGAAGVNGGVLLGIYGAGSEFGTTKILSIDDATLTSLKNDAIYVNAHSTAKPGGIVRGQIR